jgi:hypothetical protein
MPNFSRRTILAALDTFENMSHSEIDRYLLDYGLENVAPAEAGNKQKRATLVAAYLFKDPERRDEDGRNLVDTIVQERVQRAISACSYGGFNFETFQKHYAAIHRGLERDGFTIEDGQLRRALPDVLDLPKADDEVHALLHAYNLTTPRGHLDQAISAHSRGDWAAANAQFRPFVESLFDEIAEQLNRGVAGLPPPGHPRRQWLANTNPPFFIAALNEWSNDGKGFVEGFYRRLHPAGAHPGLSDEDDSTFRLHLVLLVARLLLRRLRQLRPI